MFLIFSDVSETDEESAAKAEHILRTAKLSNQLQELTKALSMKVTCSLFLHSWWYVQNLKYAKNITKCLIHPKTFGLQFKKILPKENKIQSRRLYSGAHHR